MRDDQQTKRAERAERRRASVPAIAYPGDLPIAAHADEIVAAIREHAVVIVAGETGSGKSTQLPKMCLAAGRGIHGLIGHTQPRRIAARAVAERLAEELGTAVGGLVGYTVRFADRVRDQTLVRVMTDGIVLAELPRDRMLRRYDTIIVDEAHERSLNIDFLLGYLKQLVERRRDLKVVVTSATIDTARFSRHFDDAPVIEVAGRSYPVEVRYRPIEEADERRSKGAGRQDDEAADQARAMCDAVEELWTEGPGDILVFLSGEREIRDTADALRGRRLPETEILPLYARLSAAEQHRVFEAHPGRRVVLATNVAETSITVPGIRYVVDPGTARISRYARGTKVQRLPIEPISQASANQRAGRCGRIAPGICIRLYSREDFESRPAFTEPEILRTSLAAVVLQMSALGLGDIEAFPFVEPPDRRNVNDAVGLLRELQAVDGRGALTQPGRQMSRLPLDPRLGRMILEAGRRGCLREVLVIASALSIQDPRERPVTARKEADASHARFADEHSDFLSFWNLWDSLQSRQRGMSSSKFRKLCRSEFLSAVRVREWQDVHAQLVDVVRDLGLTVNRKPADPERIHRALLAGLLSNIGLRDRERNEYRGARDARFALSPGSVLFAARPKWIMAAEVVETTRPWAHVAARIDPAWAEPLAGELLKHTHGEPAWDDTRGSAVVPTRVTLYGLPIVEGRRTDYGRVDRGGARELFIRHALVGGEWRAGHRFAAENRALLDRLRSLEERARRPSHVVDEDAVFSFFEERVGTEVVSKATFDEWWASVEPANPQLLTLTEGDVVRAEVGIDDYPDTWDAGGVTLRLSYVFDPSADDDGMTVHVPLTSLNQVDEESFSWHVPGYREDLVVALLRSLPKDLRRRFVPPADAARELLAQLRPEQRPLTRAVASATGVDPGAFDVDRIPPYLRPRFLIEDETGRELAAGRDLAELKRALAPQVRRTVARAGADLETSGHTDWTFGDVPEVVRIGAVAAYPAITDEKKHVAVKVFESAEEQRRHMRAGLRRLLVLRAAPPIRALDPLVPRDIKLGLTRRRGAVDDCLTAVAESFIAETGHPVRDKAAFEALLSQARPGFAERAIDALTQAGTVLLAEARIAERLAARGFPADAADDMRHQVAALAGPGFVTRHGVARLGDLRRYLDAVEHRIEKVREDPARDARLMDQVHRVAAEWAAAGERAGGGLTAADRAKIRWMLEELRVSLFAQHLGTAYRVSEQRILREIAEITGA